MSRNYNEKMADMMGRLGYHLSVEELEKIQEVIDERPDRDALFSIMGRMGYHLSLEELDEILHTIKD